MQVLLTVLVPDFLWVFEVFVRFPWGSRPPFLPFRPCFRVCVSVAAFLSTETSLYSSFGAVVLAMGAWTRVLPPPRGV